MCRAGKTAQRHRVHRGTASVHGRQCDLLSRQPFDHLTNVPLQGVRLVEVPLGSPARRDTGTQHKRMLAGAVHPDAGRFGMIANQLVPRTTVSRPDRRAREVVLSKTALSEHGAHHFGMGIGAGMTCRSQRQLLALERGTGGHTRHRLQRLQARSRQDHGGGVSERRHNLALGGQHDGSSDMPRFHEIATLDDRKFNGLGNSESLQHANSLPSGPAPPSMTGPRVPD